MSPQRSICLSLPWPPTVNTYWRSLVLPVGRKKDLKPGEPRKFRSTVILSEAGRAYRELVAKAVTDQRVPVGQLTGKLAVWIHCLPPDRRARDLDNLPKGVLDGLKHAGVLEDDSFIDDLRVTRFGTKPGGEIQLRISEIPGAATESGDLFRQSAHAPAQ